MTTWSWLYGFENRRRLFSIHTDYPFACVIVSRRKSGIPLKTAFREVDVSTWESSSPPCIMLDEKLIALFSPESWSIPEIRRQRDLTLLQKIYHAALLLGQTADNWTVEFSLELMMNVKAKDFPSVESWSKRGWIPDVFGRWVREDVLQNGWQMVQSNLAAPLSFPPRSSNENDVGLPLYEGIAFGILDPFEKAFVEAGSSAADWRPIPHDTTLLKTHFAISENDAQRRCPHYSRLKVLFRDVTNSTNERSLISCVIKGLPCGNTAATLHLKNHGLVGHLLLSACLSSLAIDFATRQRLTGKHLNWFIAKEIPLPKVVVGLLKGCGPVVRRLAMSSARLSSIHRRFAPEWLLLKDLFSELAEKEWKRWWAVTEADRLRLRVEIDALCADLYGLESDDFDWIVRDDPKDPKGFYRVDRRLPFGERLTGLAAAAFRALKDGKWSAESAAKLSNDEFFEIVGIPELTIGSDPLIRKRTGCHIWKPEAFGPDDPRYGWTWDHCWQDAVALLGSEEAVRKYITGRSEQDNEPTSDGEAFQLRNRPQKAKQTKMF